MIFQGRMWGVDAWVEDMRDARKDRFAAWKAQVRSDWKPDLVSARCCFFFLGEGTAVQ